jgi:hypothetical protein
LRAIAKGLKGEKKIMKKGLVSLFIIAMFLASLAPTMIVPTTVAIPDYEPIDIGPQLRASDHPINIGSLTDDYGSGNPTKVWLYLDNYLGFYFFDMFELRANGTSAEIWVQLDLSWNETDPRPVPIITDEQVDYLLSEFENNMYPTDTGYFGIPDFHDGAFSLLEAFGIVPPGYYYDVNGRSVILVSNIRDENYYNSTYPYYVAGFFSPTLELYFDRNVISIDAYDWENRLGPDVDRPYGYEATTTHELQHLIHADYVPGDDDFINEGCSMFAQVLCGYGIPWGDINSYLYTPDNSLTKWGDQGDINILADYGAAALWAIYLNDQYGPSFWSDFMAAGIPSIDGLNTLLAPQSFDEVYHDWRIANLIHTDSPGGGIYNYVTIDLGSLEAIPARTYDIRKPLVGPIASMDFGSTITILGYDTGMSRIDAYGSDYIKFNNLKDRFEPLLMFDGDDYAVPVTWIRQDMDDDGDFEWYSTTGDLLDLSIVTEYTLPTGTVTLTVDTSYDIEDYWDYGFVQVSTDGGATWTSISSAYTTSLHDPSAHPDIVANLPGLTGYQDWVPMDFDLSAYAEETVLIRFRYMTDWAFANPGWWIDDIRINGVLIDDADSTIVFEPILPETDFMVTVISVEYEKREMPKYKLLEDITLDDLTETGMKYLDHFIEKRGSVLLIVSPILGPTDYTFSVVAGE